MKLCFRSHYSTYKLNNLGRYEYFKMIFMSPHDFFNIYQEDVNSLNCIEDDVIVDVDNIVDLCLNFFHKNININSKADAKYFNNISRKKQMISEARNKLLNLNKISIEDSLKKKLEEDSAVLENYMKENEKNPFENQTEQNMINLDGFIINCKQDIINYLKIKRISTFNYILTVEKNERIADKDLVFFENSASGGKSVVRKKKRFAVDPRKTSRLVVFNETSYEINKENIEEALKGAVLKRSTRIGLQRKNQFVFNFMLKWNFNNNPSTFLKNIKREFIFDKLTLQLGTLLNVVLNFDMESMIVIRNLYNLFLNKHNFQISTLLQNVVWEGDNDDVLFDEIYMKEMENAYPSIFTNENKKWDLYFHVLKTKEKRRLQDEKQKQIDDDYEKRIMEIEKGKEKNSSFEDSSYIRPVIYSDKTISELKEINLSEKKQNVSSKTKYLDELFDQ